MAHNLRHARVAVAAVAIALALLAAVAAAAPARATARTTSATGAATVAADTSGPITYTVEPFDFDGYFGINMTVTQNAFGGSLCPCVKIPYIADGMPWNNQTGADNIAKVDLKPGDTVMGFSLGAQVLSLYLSQHTPPPGVKFLLFGDTFWRNQQFLDSGVGIPWDIANQVTFVANEYDGYSDYPDNTSSPGYSLAVQNAFAGTNYVHNYVFAKLDDPANVVTHRGNITAILIPNQTLPNNNWLRPGNNALADQLDAQQRAQIDDAYSRPGPTAAQRAAATDEQVPIPAPAIQMRPEPVADLS